MGKRKYHARAFQRFITDTAKRVVLDIIKYFAQHTADDIFTEQFFDLLGIFGELISAHQREDQTDDGDWDQPDRKRTDCRESSAVGHDLENGRFAAAAAERGL